MTDNKPAANNEPKIVGEAKGLPLSEARGLPPIIVKNPMPTVQPAKAEPVKTEPATPLPTPEPKPAEPQKSES